MGRKRVENISFSRIAALVDRFAEWKEKYGHSDFTIGHWAGYTHDFDLGSMIEEKRLRAVEGWNLEVILLGGLPERPENEMRNWLRERKEAGFATVIASFTGYGAFHDRWNGRRGDFERLMHVQRIAADLGMGLHQRIFLTRSTLPLVDELLDKLDALPGEVVEREAYLLFYSGFARRLENERITEDMLDSQPEHIRRLYRSDWKKWRSERSWVEVVREEDENTPEKVPLRLILTDSNIDRIESMSCEAILAELENRTREAYAAIPSRHELCERYGDASNTKVYMFLDNIESKWLDAFLKHSPVQFERQLLHIGDD